MDTPVYTDPAVDQRLSALEAATKPGRIKNNTVGLWIAVIVLAAIVVFQSAANLFGDEPASAPVVSTLQEQVTGNGNALANNAAWQLKVESCLAYRAHPERYPNVPHDTLAPGETTIPATTVVQPDPHKQEPEVTYLTGTTYPGQPPTPTLPDPEFVHQGLCNP